jgi:hypothetical protein
VTTDDRTVAALRARETYRTISQSASEEYRFLKQLEDKRGAETLQIVCA